MHREGMEGMGAYEERAMEMAFSCTGKMERWNKPFVGFSFVTPCFFLTLVAIDRQGLKVEC